MPLDIVLGAQWGDEGKGRMVDLLAAGSQVVARYSGGDNAGHTVTVGDQIFKLHLVPSGIVHPQVVGVMGNGMVINPETLLHEIDLLKEKGVAVSPGRLKISPAAHLITPAHRALDAAQEAFRGKDHIGTTLRGIGPAYADKAARQGLRVEEMLDEESLADRVKDHVEFANRRLTNLYDADPLDAGAVAAQFVDHARHVRPYIADTARFVNQALKEGGRVLAEGAQGALLDLDHGTYPYVTSSCPTAAGALIGLGVGPRYVGDVIAVAKAFQTRVGEGALPTELEGELALQLRGTGENPWDEYGTTTGRPRRVGWLDLVLLRYAVHLNGVTHLALTKLDILTGIHPLRLCVAYQRDGETFPDLPMGLHDLGTFQPVYRDLPGWDEDVQSARAWKDLPSPAQNYVQAIEEQIGVPVRWISVGPERTQLVVR
jgi:adenylosuccinate synthase